MRVARPRGGRIVAGLPSGAGRELGGRVALHIRAVSPVKFKVGIALRASRVGMSESGGSMQKRELLLAAMSAGGGEEHTPVQVQKLVFLIEQNVAADLGGSTFDFVPYDYGPFDSSLYEVLRQLEAEGLATATVTSRGWKKYSLTPEGQRRGAEVLDSTPARASNYIRQVSAFVLRLSFADLVSAVYKAYPDMKVNSVFRG